MDIKAWTVTLEMPGKPKDWLDQIFSENYPAKSTEYYNAGEHLQQVLEYDFGYAASVKYRDA